MSFVFFDEVVVGFVELMLLLIVPFDEVVVEHSNLNLYSPKTTFVVPDDLSESKLIPPYFVSSD